MTDPRSRCCTALALLALCFPQSLRGQQKEPEDTSGIAWEADLDQALQRAKSQGKPLMVAFLMDDEPANDEVARKHYHDKDVIAASRKFVCCVGSLGEHKGENGQCARFAGITCAQHQAVEKAARARFLRDDIVLTPQHVFCDANAKELLRKVYLLSKQELVKAMGRTLASAGRGDDPIAKEAVTSDKTLVEKCLKDLSSKTLEVREAALRELAGCDDERALPAVVQRTRPGGDEATRIAAVRALGRKGSLGSVRPLCALLSDQKPLVVTQALLALEYVQLPQALGDLTTFAKKERKDKLRGLALRAAAKSHPKSATVRDACIAGLKGANNMLESHLLVALGALAPDPFVCATVEPKLKDTNQSARALAAWVLGSQKSQAHVPALEQMAKEDKSLEVRELCTKVLKRCRGEAVESYDSLYAPFMPDYDY